MKKPINCPRCGVQLPTQTEAGSPCPRCLMQLGFEESSPSSPLFDVPELDEVIETFPQLEILEHVGTGGMGVVYHARQKGLDRDVALKLVSVDVTADPAFAERFTREARALASLTHPAITGVFDFGQVGRFYYLIMEYVDGANLRQILNTGGLSSREAMTMVSRMCDALQYAHDNGIVHRDIKPENLLVDRAGQLKIIDFGLAKMIGLAPAVGGLTRTDQAMGTWHYMAPEQVERPLEVDHRADIFSLGVVFYELLTGELPLGRFSPPSERGDMDARLDKIVMRALEKEPAERYQRAGQVKTDLDVVSRTRGGPQLAAAYAPEPPAKKERSTSSTIFMVLGGCLGIMLLFGCLGALLLGLFAVNPAPNGSSVESFSYSIDGTPILVEPSPDAPSAYERGLLRSIFPVGPEEPLPEEFPVEIAPEEEPIEDPLGADGALAPGSYPVELIPDPEPMEEPLQSDEEVELDPSDEQGSVR